MMGNLLRYDPSVNKSFLLDFHPFDDLSDYFNLLYAANVVFDYEHNSFDDSISSESPAVFFNAHTSPDFYYERLSNLNVIAHKEFNKDLRSHELKHDKLIYLLSQIKKIEEYKNYLIKDTNGQFSHLLFSFSNKCTEESYIGISYSQSDFQQYFLWMNFFLDKSRSYLTSLFEITEKTNQADFPINHIAFDINASTVNDPFKYLNYLFANNGIMALLRAFIPDEEYMAAFDIVYDKDTETKTEVQFNPNTEKEETYVVKFSDKLLKILTVEYHKSMKLVREKLSEEQDETIIKLYLKKNLNLLKYLLKKVEENGYKDKYPLTELLLLSFITWLFEEYEVFCPSELGVLFHTSKKRRLELRSFLNSTSSNPKYLPASNVSVQGFVWLSNDERLCQVFYIELCSGSARFIDSGTDPQSINKLFSIPGNYASVPKIRWQLMHKDKPNKTILLYLFTQLIENNLIEYVSNKNLMNKINEFFCWDENQSEFPNLAVSLSTSKKKIASTPEKRKVDQIIQNLKNVMIPA